MTEQELHDLRLTFWALCAVSVLLGALCGAVAARLDPLRKEGNGWTGKR